MNLHRSDEPLLDLERDHPVTPEDVVAQRRLRAALPSWLMLDWVELDAMIPSDALDRRPPADDRWLPFSLD